MRTRVKICGITRHQDAVTAVRSGADAIGLVFYPPSHRAVSAEQAADIISGLPPFVTITGLFVDAERKTIENIMDRITLDLLQFHGNETPEACTGYSRPILKAVRMHDNVNLHTERERFSNVSGLLLDAYRKGVPGGTGESFDWNRIPADLAGEIVLAGGLSADNVEQAIHTVQPYAVDVSGGVELEQLMRRDHSTEQTRPIKSQDKIKAFMRGVRQANDPHR